MMRKGICGPGGGTDSWELNWSSSTATYKGGGTMKQNGWGVQNLIAQPNLLNSITPVTFWWLWKCSGSLYSLVNIKTSHSLLLHPKKVRNLSQNSWEKKDTEACEDVYTKHKGAKTSNVFIHADNIHSTHHDDLKLVCYHRKVTIPLCEGKPTHVQKWEGRIWLTLTSFFCHLLSPNSQLSLPRCAETSSP